MLTIEYRLTGTGWSECVLRADGETVTISASYVGDALGDLARAALALVEGKSKSRCSFHEEPGEFRWLFSRHREHVILRVLRFGERWSGGPDERGNKIFRTEMTVRELAVAVSTMLDAVLREYGAAGYAAKWARHDFPSPEHHSLTVVASDGE
jgi:hypothetical protein